MTIEFRCTQCQGTLKAPAEMAGKKAKCRKCSAVVLVPQRSAAAPQQPTITSSAPVDSRWPPGMAPAAAPPVASRAAPRNSPPPLASTPPATAPAARPVPPRAKPSAAGDKPASPPSQPFAAIPPAAAAPKPRVASPPPASSPPTPPAVVFEQSDPDDISDLLDIELPVSRADSPSFSELNPYRSPPGDAGPQRVGRRGQIESTRITYGDVMRTTWRIYKGNFGTSVAACLVALVCATVFHSLILTLANILAIGVSRLGLGMAAVYPLMGVSLLAQLFLLAYFVCGLIAFSLSAARGRSAGVSEVFSAAPYMGAGGGVLLVTLFGSIAGMFLLVVPGLLCAVLLAVSPVALVDRNEGMMPSLLLSARVMSKNFLPAFLLLISVGLVGNLVTLLTCGLGVLLVAPFQLFLLVTIYLRATGQRTAYD